MTGHQVSAESLDAEACRLMEEKLGETELPLTPSFERLCRNSKPAG